MQSDIVQRLDDWRGEMQRTIKALESNPKFADVVEGNKAIHETLGMAKTEILFSRTTIANLTEAMRASDAEIERNRAEIEMLREALDKANTPHWFYADGWEERCLHSPDEAIDLLDFPPGEYITEVSTARPCPSIWCAVRVSNDEDADERFSFTEHATEADARAALKGPSHDAG